MNQNQQVETGGLEKEIDYYGLLNLPQDATAEQIQKKFRKMSLYTHPDKAQGLASQELFVQMQKAYGYLTNPATRIIYDRFGVTGIKVYEQFKDDFREISEELRTQDLEEDKRKELESQIVRRSQNLIRSHLRNQLQTDFRKHYMMEFNINCKSFCNHYRQFYYSGQLGQSMRLIRARSMVSSVNFSVPLTQKKNHVLEFMVMAQSDIKKGLGISMYKIGHNWEFSPTVNYKSSFNFKEGDNVLSFDRTQKFLKNQLALKVKLSMSKRGLVPSISLNSSQLSPLHFDGSYTLGSNQISLGFKRDLQQQANTIVGSPWGYSCHFNIGEDHFSVSPQLLYHMSNDITLSTSTTISQAGNFTAQFGVNYNLSSSKGTSVYMQASFKEFSILESTSLIFVYNHNGYLLKLPVTLCDEGDNGSGLLMSGAIALAANGIAYGIYKLIKARKNRHGPNREQRTAFARYKSEMDRANNFIHENQIFLDRSLNIENKNLGLVIVEAYYGLADHIYQIEAGLLRFKVPETVQEFLNCQVIPVTKQLQIQVENASLVIPANFIQSFRGVFSPIVNSRAKKLLYLRYKYRDLVKVLVYDFSRHELVLPRDVV